MYPDITCDRITCRYVRRDNTPPPGMTSLSSFLTLLLQTHEQQKKALMKTLSDQQTNFITDLIYNLLYIVQLSDVQRKYINTKAKYLKHGIQGKKTIRYRRSLFQRRQTTLLKILNYFKDELLSILGSYN